MATSTLTGLRAGVLHGDEVQALFQHAKANGYALPAVNVTGTDTVNAVLEAARDLNSPVIIQFSNGGAQFFAGLLVPTTIAQVRPRGAKNERCAAFSGVVRLRRHSTGSGSMPRYSTNSKY